MVLVIDYCHFPRGTKGGIPGDGMGAINLE